jgi:hypothetical protein
LFLLISRSFVSRSQTHFGIITPNSPSHLMVPSPPHHLATTLLQILLSQMSFARMHRSTRTGRGDSNFSTLHRNLTQPISQGKRGGNASPTMNEVISGTTIQDIFVFQQSEPRCVLIRNLLQMKSMKVIHKVKNMMNKEFEHGEEL